MLNYAESFGLVILFMPSVCKWGQVLCASFRKEGVTLNMLAVAVVLLGTALCITATVLRAFLSDAVVFFVAQQQIRLHWVLPNKH